MNVILISSEIVKRVHRSPDSKDNLERVVANLIREEIERDNESFRRDATQSYRDMTTDEKWMAWRDKRILIKPDEIRHRTDD